MHHPSLKQRDFNVLTETHYVKHVLLMKTTFIFLEK